jgi:hypothetical protein
MLQLRDDWRSNRAWSTYVEVAGIVDLENVDDSRDITCHLGSFLFFDQCPCYDHLGQYTLSMPNK